MCIFCFVISVRPLVLVCARDSLSPTEWVFVKFYVDNHYENLLTFALWLTHSDPTSDLVRQYDFPVLLRCRKTSGTVFVAFVRPLSEPVRRFFLCSTDFSQQIAQFVLFLFFHVFSLLKL
jgi:hypothetical protein